MATVNGFGCCCGSGGDGGLYLWWACCPLGPGPCSRSLRLSWNALCSAIRAAIVSGEFVGYETAGCCVNDFAVLVVAIGWDGRFELVAVLITITGVVVRGAAVVVLVVVVVVVVGVVAVTVAASAPTGPAIVVISSSK